MTELLLRSQYFLLLDDALLVDCCEARRQQLEDEGYGVKVLACIENPYPPYRHCRLGCLYNS